MTAIDIRANVYCSLGTVISGNFADTYAQSSGLIFTRGSVEIDGIIKPDVGTSVQFAYSKGSYIARLPRTLRVLSSFADPFRRKTTVQLGCLLTFLETRKPPIEEPEGCKDADVPCYVYKKATIPIKASYVVSKILDTLGIKTSAIPLTNQFSVQKFDLSPGFIQVLSDLIVSEGYIAYLDESETLIYRNLKDETGAGPVINNANIIDLSPIGVGDLPGDAVLVNYSTLRLKAPDDLEGEEERAKRNWEWEEVFGPKTEVSISYTDEAGNTQVVIDSYYPYSFSSTTYDVWDRAVERLTYEQSSVAEINARWAADRYVYEDESFTAPAGRMQYTRWTYRIPAPPNYATTSDIKSSFYSDGSYGLKGLYTTVNDSETEPASECCSKQPPEGYEDILQEVTENYISEAEVAGTLNLDSYAFQTGANTFDVLPFDTAYSDLESATRVKYEKDATSGITKTVTRFQLMYGKTTTGQQDLATLIANPPEINGFSSFESWVNSLVNKANRPREQGFELRIRTEREYGLQRRPPQDERNNTAYAKREANEEQAEVTWITGGTESTNYIEFNMPYAPDDKISWSEANGYSSTPSDAKQKALNFGRIQNRLLLGNRNGISVQLPVELLPPRPFDPLYLTADNLTGQYRVNGATYTFDSNGIVASADCLFWGGTG